MGLLVAGFERAHVLGFKVGFVPDLRTCSDVARRTNCHHRVRLYDCLTSIIKLSPQTTADFTALELAVSIDATEDRSTRLGWRSAGARPLECAGPPTLQGG